MTSDNFVVVDNTGEPKVIAEVAFTAALTTLHEKAIYLHEADASIHVERFDYDAAQSLCDARGLRLLHRRHRLHAGQGAGGVRERGLNGARAGARRCAGEPADRGIQEDQVLHHGKRGRGQALDARAGDAHHVVLAALSGGVPGALGGVHAHRKAERHQRAGQCPAHGGRPAADVRSARPGGRAYRGDRRRTERFEPNLYLYDNYPGGIGQSASALPPGRPAGRSTRATCWHPADAKRDARPVWVRWARSGERGKEVAARRSWPNLSA